MEETVEKINVLSGSQSQVYKDLTQLLGSSGSKLEQKALYTQISQKFKDLEVLKFNLQQATQKITSTYQKRFSYEENSWWLWPVIWLREKLFSPSEARKGHLQALAALGEVSDVGTIATTLNTVYQAIQQEDGWFKSTLAALIQDSIQNLFENPLEPLPQTESLEVSKPANLAASTQPSKLEDQPLSTSSAQKKEGESDDTVDQPPSAGGCHYSINLMWIDDGSNKKGTSICRPYGTGNKQDVLEQLGKWHAANPNAEINFWYDSERTNETAIKNTQSDLSKIPSKVYLRDIREIPFVQDNADLFSTAFPVYFCIDFLKLIISLYQIAVRGMESAIVTDLSIGDKLKKDEFEKALGESSLYNPIALERLGQFGMALGHDGKKPENQFIQVINTPELVESMTHAINSCLLMTVNTLNWLLTTKTLNEGYKNYYMGELYKAPFHATMRHIYMYLLSIQAKGAIQIRADVVNEGGEDEWVTYDPERHHYILFGNMLQPEAKGSVYLDKEGRIASMNDRVKLPEGLEFNIDTGTLSFLSEHELYLRGSLPPADPESIPSGNLYLQQQGDKLNYVVKAPNGVEVVTGTFDLKNNEPLTPATLANLKPRILEEHAKSVNMPYLANAVRKDLHPGHVGKTHPGSYPVPQPAEGQEFKCAFWPLEKSFDVNYKKDVEYPSKFFGQKPPLEDLNREVVLEDKEMEQKNVTQPTQQTI